MATMPTRRVNEPTQSPVYKSVLIAMMSYRDGIEYSKSYKFSPEELGEVTPEDVYKWMAMKVYGRPDPNNDDNPTHGRSSSLEYYKKALSYFMPNRLSTWNAIMHSGNPTRSVPVNNLIKAVKKKEVRRQGKPSQARRPLESQEFSSTMHILHSFKDSIHRYQLPALCAFQFHMVGRIDDCVQLTKINLTANLRFPFTLMAKLCWTKNAKEEREAPNQVLIASMSQDYCVLLALAVHLETECMEQGASPENPWVFSLQTNNPSNAKRKAYTILRDDVWESSEFKRMNNGLIGTHSLRKYPSTHARRNGCSRDDVAFRGCWKRRTEQVDTYIDVELPYPDAKVAAALCIGGPCKYVLNEESGVSDDWLLQYVVPNICMEFPRNVALTLARPLLWAAFEPSLLGFLPGKLTQRIQMAYALVRNLPPGTNPVGKRLIVVNGAEAELYIDEIWDPDEFSNDVGEEVAEVSTGVAAVSTVNNGGGGVQQHQQQQAVNAFIQRNRNKNEFLGLYSQQREIQREVKEIQSQISILTSTVTKGMGKMQTSLNRLSRMPAQMLRGSVSNFAFGITNSNNNPNSNVENVAVIGTNNNSQASNDNEQTNMALDPVYNSSLSKTPKTLFILWQEWEVGITGRKPARIFTRAERGRTKFIYYRRKVFWDTVAGLVRAGYTAHAAIDRIYEAYGPEKTVTQILNQMLKDRHNGGHPQLRV